MEPETASTPWAWIFAAIGSVGSILGGTIAKLYHSQVKLYETRITGLEGQVCTLSTSFEKCQQEHTKTQVDLAELRGKIAVIEKTTLRGKTE